MQADETARVFIGMGSNLGNSLENLLLAWDTLSQDRRIHCVALSSPYQSAPVDMFSQHWFSNAVGELRTSLAPHELLGKLFSVEEALGRVRDNQAFGYQDREIDLDLLYFGDQEIIDPDLILPHPHIHDRLFVLSPMVELAPEFVDHSRNRTTRQLHQRLLERISSGEERRQEISKVEWPEKPDNYLIGSLDSSYK